MKLAQKSLVTETVVAVGEFKAKCLRLMDQALVEQRPLTVTKRGKVIGQFVPASPQPKPPQSIFGMTPVVRMPTDAEWKAVKEEWAEEWEKSTERLARQIKGDFRETE